MRGSLPLLLALVALLSAPSPGDEVVLRSGARLSCEVLEELEDEIVVRLPKGEMVIPRDRIERIERESRGRYLMREGRQSLRQGSAAGAVDLYRRALEANPADPDAERGLRDALIGHARALLGQFRLEECKAVATELLELEPGHAGAREILARVGREGGFALQLHAAAREALAEGDFARALGYLDAWRLRLPVGDDRAKREMADVHLLAGKEALRQSMPRVALDHYRAAASFGESRVSGQALRLLKPIAVLEELKDGDLRESLRLLASIGNRYPDPAVPVFLRAVIHHVAGEVEEAVAAYAEAARIAQDRDPERSLKGLGYDVVRVAATATLAASIAQPPQAGVERWREMFLGPLERADSGDHFIVYAPTRKSAEEIAGYADEIYGRIARELIGAVPETEKAEIVVHAARQAYVAADPTPRESPLASLTIPRDQTAGVCHSALDEEGRRVVRVEVYAGGARLMEDTLPHEIVHVVQRRGLAVHRRGHWLDEGLAMLYESEQGRSGRLQAMKLAGDVMPLSTLLALRSTPPGSPGLFYNQSYAVAEYLRGLGSGSDWIDFLEAYGRLPIEKALAEVYGIESIDLLERQLLQHYGLTR